MEPQEPNLDQTSPHPPTRSLGPVCPLARDGLPEQLGHSNCNCVSEYLVQGVSSVINSLGINKAQGLSPMGASLRLDFEGHTLGKS